MGRRMKDEGNCRRYWVRVEHGTYMQPLGKKERFTKRL